MREIETDYLVVGAGASGMAFADVIVEHTDAEVVLVDRRHRPGGHWLDAYPFVRLHQPSAYYGVASRPLGNDRIDETGVNAGFYERASAAEICDYFGRVLDEQMLPSGRVQFLPMSDYRGSDANGHHVVSVLDGAETTIKVRRKLVDATYVESQIPKRNRPTYTVADGVTLIPPNDLVELDRAPERFTVIGAGKTALDTCNWLLDVGVDADRIRWIRGRDPWLFERTFMQPLDLIGSYMQLQASWVEAAAAAEDGQDFARRLEDSGVFVRIDPSTEPLAFRGATISRPELEALRTIENVVRARRVLSISPSELTADAGTEPVAPEEVFVDCTAAGLSTSPAKPVFEPGRITMQLITIGVTPWSAATIGFVETLDTDDSVKNTLCPPVVFTGDIADVLQLANTGMTGLLARSGEPAVAAWTNACRLNPARAVMEHMGDPDVVDAFGRMGAQMGAAMENLARRAPLATA